MAPSLPRAFQSHAVILASTAVVAFLVIGNGLTKALRAQGFPAGVAAQAGMVTGGIILFFTWFFLAIDIPEAE